MLGQTCCRFKIACYKRNDCIAVYELAGEATVFSVPLRLPDPTYALNDSQPGSDLHACDFSNENAMRSLASFWVPLFDKLADSGAARFSDVVFDQGAGIEVVEGHSQRRFSIIV